MGTSCPSIGKHFQMGIVVFSACLKQDTTVFQVGCKRNSLPQKCGFGIVRQ